MSAQILDGKNLAEKLKTKLSAEVRGLRSRTGAVPRLINIMIGSDPGSCAYASSQQRAARAVGVAYELCALPADAGQDDLLREIGRLNADPAVHGIMIHKPVPAQIDYGVAANALDLRKDLEGINVANIGKMLLGETALIPCTPAAVMEHIHSTGIPLRGREAVIVGASTIVGKPLSLLLLAQMATVTVCHIATSEAGRLAEHVRRADVLVVAAGRPGLIPGEWIKPGATVVDVGINAVEGKITGDVEFAAARGRAAFITPVPGGVGPVTVVMLMRNGIEAFKLQQR